MLFEAVLSKVIPPWATVVAIEALVGTLARVRPDVTVNLEECGADPLAVIAEESTALKIVKGLLRGVLYRYNLLGTAHAGLLGLLLLNITWPGHICIEDLQGKKESGRLKFYSKVFWCHFYLLSLHNIISVHTNIWNIQNHAIVIEKQEGNLHKSILVVTSLKKNDISMEYGEKNITRSPILKKFPQTKRQSYYTILSMSYPTNCFYKHQSPFYNKTINIGNVEQ